MPVEEPDHSRRALGIARAVSKPGGPARGAGSKDERLMWIGDRPSPVFQSLRASTEEVRGVELSSENPRLRGSP